MLAIAIVGGAIIPPLTGHLADHIGLHAALALPALCYALIAAFGLIAGSRRGTARVTADPPIIFQ